MFEISHSERKSTLIQLLLFWRKSDQKFDTIRKSLSIRFIDVIWSCLLHAMSKWITEIIIIALRSVECCSWFALFCFNLMILKWIFLSLSLNIVSLVGGFHKLQSLWLVFFEFRKSFVVIFTIKTAVCGIPSGKWICQPPKRNISQKFFTFKTIEWEKQKGKGFRRIRHMLIWHSIQWNFNQTALIML